LAGEQSSEYEEEEESSPRMRMDATLQSQFGGTLHLHTVSAVVSFYNQQHEQLFGYCHCVIPVSRVGGREGIGSRRSQISKSINQRQMGAKWNQVSSSPRS